MNDSAYIIDIEVNDETVLQVFAQNKFEMQTIVSKASDNGELVRSVSSIGDIMMAHDYIDDDNEDLNFGIQN